MAGTKKKQVPELRSEDEERAFWAENDSTEFMGWRTARKRRLPNLKPTPRARLERERRRA